jgi:peroxiredoxin
MALPAPRVLAHRCVDCSIALWQGLSNSRVARVASLVRQPERKMAADFSLNDASGNPVRISALKGKVVLLNFWATWCGGCQVEIPWFVEFAGKYRDGGLAIIGVSMDDDGWKSVKPYVRLKKVNYPIVIGNDDVSKRYGLGPMPMTLIIDRAGRVAATHVGLVRKSDYAAEIEALLAERSYASVSSTQ